MLDKFCYQVSFRLPVAELQPLADLQPVAELQAVVASPCSSLSNDFGQMLLHGIYSDVTVTAGTKVFDLHRSVLASE